MEPCLFSVSTSRVVTVAQRFNAGSWRVEEDESLWDERNSQSAITILPSPARDWRIFIVTKPTLQKAGLFSLNCLTAR